MRHVSTRVCGISLASVVLIFAPLGGPAFADSGGTPASAFGPAPDAPASGWQIGYYTPSPKGTLSYAQAFKGSGEASLNFTSADNTALLITSQKAKFPTLLGNLSNATSITFNFGVSGATGAFTYYGEPSCGGLPTNGGPTATVRFYFQTSNAGGFNEANYWWSNPISYSLTTNASNQMLSNPFGTTSGMYWSDYYGHFGNTAPYSAGFQKAIANVTDIGVSFGGGCFFENGVGTTNGSGTFTINSFAVS
jgi:hypothetical protein